MMANVIATVLYNTQVSQMQLEKLSSDLNALSGALAGGREMRDMLDRVVETMMRVLGADASALFVVDEVANKVVAQAAAGYQKALVAAEPSTSWVKGSPAGSPGKGGRCGPGLWRSCMPILRGKASIPFRVAASRTPSWGCRSSSPTDSAVKARSSAS